jgi:RNA 2',3'-cyclic 3'-phosphodiesterase
MTRTFVAVELGDEARAHLAREIARLDRALPSVRWADPANLHLTLVFLGELDDERLASVHEAVQDVAPNVKPFTLAVAGLGTFGSLDAPRVVWAGLGGNLRRLTELHDALAAALEARGFTRESRPFSPHLTLARLKAPLSAGDAHRLASLVRDGSTSERTPGAPFPVDHINIMKSELLRPAARYTSLRAVRLGMAAEP